MDFLSEQNNEKLLRNSSLQRCLSIQNALDFSGELHPRRMSARIAWATLHLKMSSVGFAYFMNNVARTGGPRVGESENKAGQPSFPHKTVDLTHILRKALCKIYWV